MRGICCALSPGCTFQSRQAACPVQQRPLRKHPVQNVSVDRAVVRSNTVELLILTSVADRISHGQVECSISALVLIVFWVVNSILLLDFNMLTGSIPDGFSVLTQLRYADCLRQLEIEPAWLYSLLCYLQLQLQNHFSDRQLSDWWRRICSVASTARVSRKNAVIVYLPASCNSCW